MPDTDETQAQETQAEQVPAESPEVQAAEPQGPVDPQEERMDRKIAQRLGRYAARVHEAEEKAERTIAEYRERLANLEGQTRILSQQRQAQQPALTLEQVQQYAQARVDRGEITPMAGATIVTNFIAQQRDEHLMRNMREQREMDAAQEKTERFIRKVPALKNTNSPEFQKVSPIAHKLARLSGRDVSDWRIQAEACELALGDLDAVENTARVREFDRVNADTHAATGNGGANRQAPKKDPLAGASPEQIRHWDRLNYSQKAREDEMVFIRAREARKRVG